LAVHGQQAIDREASTSKPGSDGQTKEKLPPLIPGQAKADGVPVQHVKENGDGFKVKDEMTKPPPRINEAKLLSLMEHAGRQVEDEELASALMSAEGLGTAATRADIIQNLKVKEYVDADLRPTIKGIQLIETLDRLQVQRLTSAELTARLELELAEVEKGERSAQRFMQSVVDYTKEVVNAAKSLDMHPVRRAIASREPQNGERAGATARTSQAEPAVGDASAVAQVVVGPCPLHPGTGCQVIETRASYMCTTKLDAWRNSGGKDGGQDVAGVSLPKILCQRPISLAEAKAYLTGSTGELKGFISKQGKPFSAKLVLTPSGRANFLFPERRKSQWPKRRFGEDKKTLDRES
jgi:DNA topoisomerase-3